ncbi:membrane protein [Beggiatoa sp. PS]|nr:membrane protein [Beggiatoa sp. PS]
MLKKPNLAVNGLKKPQILLRLGVGLVIFFILLLTVFIVIAGIDFTVKDDTMDGIEFVDFLQILEVSVNMLILIGAALFFFVTTETRKKRKRAMMNIHELRVLAHVIDMHQLTKDPERVFSEKNRTASSPQQTMTAFELTRYLDYCAEMLSLVGKVAALYAQDFEDEVVLTAVNDIETLTTGLSRKIWQKIVILYRFKQQ